MYALINGLDTQEYKLRVTDLPPIQIAQKRVEQIIVPGRSGILTRWDGSYEEMIKTVGFFYNGSSPETIARLILEGSTVTFSNEPDFVYDYRLDITTDLTKTISTWHQFIVQFICNPVKRELSPEIILASSALTLINPGNHPAYPTFALTGSGNVTLTVGDQEIELADISPGITVDGNLMECYQGDESANSKMSGDFPVINAGESVYVSWTGSVTAVEITPNWRWV